MYNQGFVSNSFTYEGKINVKLKCKDKIYTLNTHNTGTKLLVDTIAKALSGTSVADNVPRYLDFIYGEKDDKGVYIKEDSLLKTVIPFVGKVYGDMAKTPDLDENCSCLLLSATISAADRNLIQTTPNKQLRMLDSKKQPLAFIENPILDTLYDSLKDGTDAIIEWRMIFSNKVEEELDNE